MTIQTGDRYSRHAPHHRHSEGPKPTTTGDYFGGRRVALFAVPGATPRLLGQALAVLRRKGGDLRAKGVDEIACTSVNDAFVMAAWNKDQGSQDITMIADGNGKLAEALGLTMDGSNFGMGAVRSQRYSMIVNDGVVEQLNVEAPGGISRVERRDPARATVRRRSAGRGNGRAARPSSGRCPASERPSQQAARPLVCLPDTLCVTEGSGHGNKTTTPTALPPLVARTAKRARTPPRRGGEHGQGAALRRPPRLPRWPPARRLPPDPRLKSDKPLIKWGRNRRGNDGEAGTSPSAAQAASLAASNTSTNAAASGGTGASFSPAAGLSGPLPPPPTRPRYRSRRRHLKTIPRSAPSLTEPNRP